MKHATWIRNLLIFSVWWCEDCGKWGLGTWRGCFIDGLIHREASQ